MNPAKHARDQLGRSSPLARCRLYALYLAAAITGSAWPIHARSIRAAFDTFEWLKPGEDVLAKVQVTADSGFHSRAVLAAVEELGANAYIADRDLRRRDPAFAWAGRHKERSRSERARKRRQQAEQKPKETKHFTLKDFIYDEKKEHCTCPAGHKMYHAGKDMAFNGYRASRFKAPLGACGGCELRSQCLRHPESTPQRSLTILKRREGPRTLDAKRNEAIERMRRKLDTPLGREVYSRRMGTVEPVFGNLQNKGMRRFTLRGRRKVNVQWQLFTMVHNIEKIAGRGGLN